MAEILQIAVEICFLKWKSLYFEQIYIFVSHSLISEKVGFGSGNVMVSLVHVMS